MYIYVCVCVCVCENMKQANKNYYTDNIVIVIST